MYIPTYELEIYVKKYQRQNLGADGETPELLMIKNVALMFFVTQSTFQNDIPVFQYFSPLFSSGEFFAKSLTSAQPKGMLTNRTSLAFRKIFFEYLWIYNFCYRHWYHEANSQAAIKIAGNIYAMNCLLYSETLCIRKRKMPPLIVLKDSDKKGTVCGENIPFKKITQEKTFE